VGCRRTEEFERRGPWAERGKEWAQALLDCKRGRGRGLVKDAVVVEEEDDEEG